MPDDKPPKSLSGEWDDIPLPDDPTGVVAPMARMAFYRGALAALACLMSGVPYQQLKAEIIEALDDNLIDFGFLKEDRVPNYGALDFNLDDRPKYFIQIGRTDLFTGAETPSGEEVEALFLQQGHPGETEMDKQWDDWSGKGPFRMMLHKRDGTPVTGHAIKLDDIVSWALMKGFLDDPGYKEIGLSEASG